MQNRKSRYDLSEDELMHYQQQQEKAQEPAKKAAEMLEAGINMILAELGVDLNLPIPQQQEELGIIIQEHTTPEEADLNGFYIHQVRDDIIQPIAWVGDARLDNTGKAWITIWPFNNNSPHQIGGVKLN